MHARGLNLASLRVLRSAREGTGLGGALAVLCMTVGLFALAAAPASAALPTQFGSGGSGAGQFAGPTGVAVNNDPSNLSFGDVYVVDANNNRIGEFSGEGGFMRAFGWDVNKKEPKEELQECTTASGCQAGSAGAGVGQFGGGLRFLLGGIAVDNSENPLDMSVGDVYVLDQGNGRVEKFDAEGHFLLQFPAGGSSIAVGPTGKVYVGEGGAVQEYDPETGKAEARVELEGAGGIIDLAINAIGDIYTTEFFGRMGETLPVHRYSAAGVLLGVLDSETGGHAHSLALDAAGEVFVDHVFPSPEPEQIRGFSPAGVQVTAFATAAGVGREGLAFGEQSGALYMVEGGLVSVFVPSGPGPIVSGESADHIEPTAALVHAVIGPDAPPTCGETHYKVEYGLTPGYGKSAPVEEGALPRSFEEDPVEVPLTGLTPRTEYHYRFVAFEECELEPKTHPGVKTTFTSKGEDATFTTLQPALIEEEFSTDVRSTSATINATVNPLGFSTEYHFLYSPCGTGECAIPIPDEAIGSGKSDVAVQQHLQGLTAGQTYHYHLLASNPLGEVAGEERSFTTQTGGEAGLPDSREWELVSPPAKHGAQLFGAEEHSFLQAAASGGGIVYQASAPTESQPQGNGEIMQVLAQRSGSGWSNVDLAIPHSFPSGVDPQMAYRVFSSDLTLGVLQPAGSFEPGLSKEANEQTPYLRESTTGVFTPLVTPVDDTTNPFIPFGEEASEGQCKEILCGPEFRGATPDFSHIVLAHGVNRREAPLLQGTPADSLYEWAGGKLALVSELPENPPEVTGGPTLGGFNGTVTTHAVSNDGSRIFWTAGGQTPVLFMRDMTRRETIEIGSGEANFEGANTAGTLVFYSGKECEILTGKTHLECRPVTGEGGKPLEDGTVLATSEDGTWVYFRKEANIYARRGSEAAKLVASNIGSIKPPGVGSGFELEPQHDPWRASPDGEWFAFMSDSPLTGYDNHDAATGQPDMEVYLYGAGAGRLVCVSCDPTGARPDGAEAVHLNLAGYGVKWPASQGIAASVSGWGAYDSNGHALYDPRFLSDSGRLFFDAVGGLVPRDVNGQVDVYQFEPSGVGDCTASTQTGTVVYSAAAGGCVALISSGESPEESVFEDASESGEDVFFLSSSRLSTADLDGSLSMWDAHACTAASPCLPAPVARPPLCDTEASCKAAPSPQPAIFGAPASATFVGAGNVVSSGPVVSKVAKRRTVACKRGLTRRKGRCVRGKRKMAGKSNHGGGHR